jgi:hypothetical protein
MTDAAFSDASPAPAPSTPSPAPSEPAPGSQDGDPADPPVDLPKPIDSKVPTKDEQPKDAATLRRESLKRAADKVNKAEAAQKKTTGDEPATKDNTPKDKPVGDDLKKDPAKQNPVERIPTTPDQKPVERPRTQTGQFTKTPEQLAAEKAELEANPHKAPPRRFIPAAHADWGKTPETIQKEVHRAIQNLEQGYEKHREKAAAYDTIAEFDEKAKKSGTTMKDAMTNYVGIEKKLREDVFGGLEQIVHNLGLRKQDGTRVTFSDIAAAHLRQPPQQGQARAEQTISELRREIAQLKQQIGGVTKTIESQKSEAILSQVEQFAASHPRFDELADDIQLLLDLKKAKSLEDAYRQAERLNPVGGGPAAPPAAKEPATPANDAPPPVNPRGQKQIAGSPATGIDPDRKDPSPTVRDAVKRAMARAG